MRGSARKPPWGMRENTGAGPRAQDSTKPVPFIPSPMHPLSHCTDVLLHPQASCSESVCLPSTAPSLPSSRLAWLCPLSIPNSFPASTLFCSSPPSSSIPTAPFQTSSSPGFSAPSSPSPVLAQPGGLLPLPTPPWVPTPPPAPELQALAPGEEQVQRGEGCTHRCQPGSASGGLQGEKSWVRGARTTHYRAPPTSPPRSCSQPQLCEGSRAMREESMKQAGTSTLAAALGARRSQICQQHTVSPRQLRTPPWLCFVISKGPPLPCPSPLDGMDGQMDRFPYSR